MKNAVKSFEDINNSAEEDKEEEPASDPQPG